MRLVPDSVAGRVTMVLMAGVILLLLLTGLVVSLSSLGEPGPPRPFRLADRIVTLAAVADRTPTEARLELLRRAAPAQLELGWSEGLGPQAALAPGWPGRGLEHRLQRELQAYGLGPVVVGRDPAPQSAWPAGSEGPPLLVWIRLTDGSWFHAKLADDPNALGRLLSFLLGLLVFVGGLALLAVRVAFWVTAPLGRLADAAARLGADVQAPPLDEAGPSEIKATARAFNQMQGRIRRLVEDRTLALAAVSHDLRTPLTRMRLRAEFALDEAERARMLADLDEMEAMIRDTLALLRAESEAGGEARARVDLAALLREIADELRAAGREVSLEAAGEVPLEARPGGLKRALRNLIENAVLHGTRARVALAASTGRAVVTIDDDGPGIPEAMLERVFTPFFRLERSRSRATGGTGLGLAVARSLLRAHGGEVALANRAGGGLRQTVTLPRG